MPHLSYWEKNFYFSDVDVAIAGAGNVGLCTGISLLEKNPSLKVLILERNYLPLGASTKNAGFACFGSPTELLDDLQKHDEQKVFSLFKTRYDGIQKLIQYTGEDAIDFRKQGGYELIHSEYSKIKIGESEIQFLNSKIHEYTGLENYFYFDDAKLDQLGFKGFSHLIANNHEAEIHPVKLINALTKLFIAKGGIILYGVGLKSWQEEKNQVEIELYDQYKFQVKQLIFCVNGFAQKIFPDLEVQAARNSVFIIESDKKIEFKGCFHLDRGYVYMRELDGRLLIGGGRNKDLKNEYTDVFGINATIQSYLMKLVKENILCDNNFRIHDQWSGILGLGPEKKPIIKMISEHTAVAVRMGGMGIALGSLVGEEAADLLISNFHNLS